MTTLQERITQARTHGDWSDIRCSVVHELWDRGDSASQIAKAIGWVSRNAVLGKLYRAGVLSRVGASPPAAARSQAPRAPRPQARTAGPRQPVAPRQRPERATDGPPCAEIIPLVLGGSFDLTPTAKHWTERTSGECAWPVGVPPTPADQFSCCAPAKGPYCPAHMAVRMSAGRGSWTSTTELIRSVRRYI